MDARADADADEDGVAVALFEGKEASAVAEEVAELDGMLGTADAEAEEDDVDAAELDGSDGKAEADADALLVPEAELDGALEKDAVGVGGGVKHARKDSCQTKPLEHKHAVWPVSAELAYMDPVGHCEQEVELGKALYVFAPQVPQTASPAIAADPAEHAEQEALLFAALTKPPLHLVQVLSNVVEPGIETKKPGRQTVEDGHATTGMPEGLESVTYG